MIRRALVAAVIVVAVVLPAGRALADGPCTGMLGSGTAVPVTC